jgi:hypothetical protein
MTGPEAPRGSPRSLRFETVALVASLVAIVAAVALCWLLLADQAGRTRLTWSSATGRLTVVLAVLWLGSAVVAALCGFLVLHAPNPRGPRPAVSLALGVVSLVAVSLTAFGLWGPLSVSLEARLMHDFRDNRSQFEAALDAYNATGSPTQLQDLGIRADAVMGEPGDGEFYLPVEMWGMSVSGWETGYAYSTKAVPPSIVGEDSGDEYSCRHIEGAWYVYHWSW